MSLLTVHNLRQHFPVRGGLLRRSVAACKAVDGVSLTLGEGETLGLVGESGCGKTTLGKAIVRLLKPTEGSIHFLGHDITRASTAALRPLRRHLQMVFQDPAESLNPRHTVRDILEEPFLVQKIGDSGERRRWVLDLLDQVGLPASAADRFPFEFSGGQRQRIGIARAIALKPKLIICDEPVSALDVSVQSQVLNLLLDLQRDLGLSYLFIAHDLGVVQHMSDRVAVMYSARSSNSPPPARSTGSRATPTRRPCSTPFPCPTRAGGASASCCGGDVPSPINPPPAAPSATA